MSPAVPHPTAHTVPPPVLFNAWKHHAGWVRSRIVGVTDELGVKVLAAEAVVIGSKLMDFYTGQLSPWEIAERVIAQLRDAGTLDREPFTGWVAAGGGFRLVELADDQSRWVLRLGSDERYVHLHTARYSPHSLRIAGISLKSAVVANVLARTRGQPVAELDTVNEARRQFLGLPPVAKLTDDGGLGEVVRLLAPPSVGRSVPGV